MINKMMMIKKTCMLYMLLVLIHTLTAQETNNNSGEKTGSSQTEAFKAPHYYRAQDNEVKLNIPFILPTGYSAKIYSSDDESTISKSGAITQQKEFSYVKVMFEITKDDDPNDKGYTRPVIVLVPAKHDLNNRYTQGTYTDCRYGVFLHLGSGGKYSDGRNGGNIDEFCNNFNVKKVANDIAAMGFQLVNITDFHGLGTTLHPNPAVDFYRGDGRYTPTRDLLGELIDELNKRGIQVSIFTHPLDGHDYFNSEYLGWSKGKSSHFQDNQRWNDYVNDCYAHIAARYGSKLVAIGFDSVLSIDQEPHVPNGIKLDRIRLRNTIKKYAPGIALVSLLGANELTDYGIKEVFTPAWIDPAKSLDTIWAEPVKVPASARNTNEYPLYNRATAIVVGDHWQPLKSKTESLPCQYTAENLFRYSVAQIGVCINGPATMWAFSPYVDGEWESDKLETFKKVNDYMKPISEALFNTYPSQAFIVRSGKKLKDYEYVSTQSRDNKYQYILVLNPPSEKTITLPVSVNGVTFSKAEVITGANKYQTAALTSNDGGYQITIRSSWNNLCTAIRLTVSNVPKVNYALFKPVEVSSSFEPLTDTDGLNVRNWSRIGKADWSRMFVNDGLRASFNKSWDHDAGSYGWSSIASYTPNKTEYIMIDMLKSYSVSKVNLFPNTDTGSFPEDFNIYVSSDAKIWSQVYSKTAQIKPSGIVSCIFKACNARFLKVEVTKLGAVDSSHFFQLAEIEIYE